MKKIFWNYSEKRLKSGWRIIVFLIGFVLVMALATLVQKALGKNIVSSLVGLLSFVLLTIGVLWLAGRYIDHRAFKDFGFNINKKWWKDFVFGIVLSALLFSVVFLVEKALGWVTIIEFFQNEKDMYKNIPFVFTLIVGLLAFATIILWEEILCRGYLMKNLSEGFNNRRFGVKGAVVLAFLLSSIFYGLVHSNNPNITLIGVVNLVILGIFFGLPYLLTGELAIPIALHFSWNFFQGLIFGFPVSGQLDKVAVFAVGQSGPELWTGGAFGPEGGLIGVFAMIAGCAIIILWIKVSRGSISLHTLLAEY
ncbi:MAG: CPBP family intramembrane metalloprotease [candidate division WOR-3 bacterium]|nr:MAG: CPBP family intramembrane metalloprotease [candidate division WOR-3 bacterium]